MKESLPGQGQVSVTDRLQRTANPAKEPGNPADSLGTFCPGVWRCQRASSEGCRGKPLPGLSPGLGEASFCPHYGLLVCVCLGPSFPFYKDTSQSGLGPFPLNSC